MTRTQEINEYIDRMYSYAIKNGVKGRCYAKYGRKHEEFDDAYQVAVLKVYQHLLNKPELVFNSNGHMASYLLQVVVNHIIDVKKSSSERNTVFYEDFNVNESDVTGWLEELSEEDVGFDEFDGDYDDDQLRQQVKLKSVMNKLRPEHATALQLLARGLEYADCAELMEVPLNTFKQFVFRARQESQKLLGGKLK